jgi:hypothetical protein
LIATSLESGEVVISTGNIPIVRPVPVKALGKRSLGALKDQISVDDSLIELLPEAELLLDTHTRIELLRTG